MPRVYTTELRRRVIILIEGGRSGAEVATMVADGKTCNEAMRSLKRRLANHIWRMMIADEWQLESDPKRQGP
jgi:hypothetical protein